MDRDNSTYQTTTIQESQASDTFPRILPDRFSSVSEPSPISIVPKELNSITEPKTSAPQAPKQAPPKKKLQS